MITITYLNRILEENEMANNRNVYQQTYTVSVPKKDLLEFVVYNKELNKKDYKVFLMLLTELDGYTPPFRSRNFDDKDPENFTKVDSEQIAEQLDMDESDVKKSIKKLLNEGIIEKGNTKNMKNGYRFRF